MPGGRDGCIRILRRTKRCSGKRVRKGETGKEEVVKDGNGQLLLESVDVQKRWAEYFDDLLNVEDAREADIVAVDGGA